MEQVLLPGKKTGKEQAKLPIVFIGRGLILVQELK